MNHKYKINQTVCDIPEALSIYMNQLVYSEKRKGIDIISLSLGEAFFEIPPFSFDEIDFNKGYHYSDSLGLPELREKIRNYYNSHYHANIPSIKNIMISCGSKAIIYMVMRLVVSQGDEVLIHEPAWVSYQEQARLSGGVPKFIPYHCDADDFDQYFTDKTKMLVLNNPNNPAGWLYDKEKMIRLYEKCRERGIFLLMDEAYSDFIGAEGTFTSLAEIVHDLEGVFIINSLSKNMGMSGWRIGYVIAEEVLIQQLLKLNQHIITCAPTVLQMYMAHYFDDIIAITLPQAAAQVEKRNRISAYLDEIGLKYLPGDSTFYLFLDMQSLQVDTLDFCLYLLFKHGIAAVPGSSYGENTEKFIRVGIGVESEERLKYALDVIRSVLVNQKTDVEYVERKLKTNGFYKFGVKG